MVDSTVCFCVCVVCHLIVTVTTMLNFCCCGCLMASHVRPFHGDLYKITYAALSASRSESLREDFVATLEGRVTSADSRQELNSCLRLTVP